MCGRVCVILHNNCLVKEGIVRILFFCSFISSEILLPKISKMCLNLNQRGHDVHTRRMHSSTLPGASPGPVRSIILGIVFKRSTLLLLLSPLISSLFFVSLSPPNCSQKCDLWGSTNGTAARISWRIRLQTRTH